MIARSFCRRDAEVAARLTGFLLGLFDRLRHAARKRRWPPDLASGRRGEDLAHRYPPSGAASGWWRGTTGPARDRRESTWWPGSAETLVFVEVKSRATRGIRRPTARSTGEARRSGACRAGVRPAGRRRVESRPLRRGERGLQRSARRHAHQGCLPARTGVIIQDPSFLPREDFTACLNCAKTPSPAAG